MTFNLIPKILCIRSIPWRWIENAILEPENILTNGTTIDKEVIKTPKNIIRTNGRKCRIILEVINNRLVFIPSALFFIQKMDAFQILTLILAKVGQSIYLTINNFFLILIFLLLVDF